MRRMDMKKCLCLTLLFFFCVTSQAFSAEEAKKTTAGERAVTVLKRGFLNAVTFPVEISSSSIREVRANKKIWPVTVWPRVVLDFSVRVTSAVNDLLFYPWITPYTDNTAPLSNSFEIPEYSWQID